MKAAGAERAPLGRQRTSASRPSEVGCAGSPTQMLNVFTPPAARKGEMLEGTPNQVAPR